MASWRSFAYRTCLTLRQRQGSRIRNANSGRGFPGLGKVIGAKSLELQSRGVQPEREIVHSIVRRFIKTGIGFLAIGLTLGVYLLARRELFGLWPHPYLVSAHAHALLVGFVMFLILGVAVWLFPRPDKTDDRYRPERIDAVYWILLASTAGRFIGEVLKAWHSQAWLSWLVILGGAGQSLGIGLFFWAMWPRIRPVGSHLREVKGERF